jgi:hypothetical protein
MAVLVHLMPEKLAASAVRNGLRRGDHGLFCMPVLPNYFVSHQWMRELKRGRGQRTFVAVSFRVRADERVRVGHYNQRHLRTTVGKAIADIMRAEDARGWEMILDRSIAPKEILSVRPVAKVVGWRYLPGAHDRPPCGCDYCQRGLYGGGKLRRRFNERERPAKTKPELWTLVDQAIERNDADALEEWLLHLRGFRDRATLRRIRALLAHPSELVRQCAAQSLK